MDNTQVIDKIRKLLALANSSNEHEAALAAGHAQRLLSAHNLAMADIDSAAIPEKADRVETITSKNLPKWIRHLVAGVSSAFDCQAIHHPDSGKLTFIGVGADAQIAVYTFAYLQRAVRRICSSYMKQQDNIASSGRQRELLRQSYYLGAVAAINHRLLSQKKETPATTGALVPLKDGLIRAAMNEMGRMRTVHGRRSHVSGDAYARGERDAKNVGMNMGVCSNGTAALQIGS
jgi:hypothetical protein